MWARHPIGGTDCLSLGLVEPRELIPWIHAAGKDQIAELAGQVFNASVAGDGIVQEILHNAADELALATRVVIERLN